MKVSTFALIVSFYHGYVRAQSSTDMALLVRDPEWNCQVVSMPPGENFNPAQDVDLVCEAAPDTAGLAGTGATVKADTPSSTQKSTMPKKKYPACSSVSPGTACTSAGDLSYEKPAVIQALCDKYVPACVKKGVPQANCQNKAKDCKSRVANKDYNPNIPAEAFGFKL